MKISNFNKPKTSATLNESLKKKFGYTLNLSQLNLPKAKKQLSIMKESIDTFKAKVGEKATTNKAYAEKLLVMETLEKYIAEKQSRIDLERREAKLKAKLQESQTQEAEVVLAAKDMVDRIQGMVEDFGEMQNEQLLPLVDQIRQTMGDETASSFETSMTAALTGAMESIRQARIDADAAARILNGEAPTTDMDAMLDEPAVDEPMGDEEVPMDEPMDELPPEGREKRDDVELDLSGL